MPFSEPVIEGTAHYQCFSALGVSYPVARVIGALPTDNDAELAGGISLEFLAVKYIDIGAAARRSNARLADDQLEYQLRMTAAAPGNPVHAVIGDQRAVIIVVGVL